MNYIDIIIIIILAMGLFSGLKKGFIIELGGIVGLLLGFYIAMNFAHKVIEWLNITGKYSHEIGYAVAFVAVLIAVALLAKVLTTIIDCVNLTLPNRVLGGLFGVVSSVVVLAFVFIVFSSFISKAEVVNEAIEESVLYGIIKDIGDTIYPYISKYLDTSKEFLNKFIEE